MSEIEYWQGFRDALEICEMEMKAKRPEKIEILKREAIRKVQDLRGEQPWIR